MQHRYLTLFSFLLLFSLSSSAFSLGLGEIQVSSHLNEPFSATIEITGTDDLSEQELLVRLADKAAFDRAGIERLHFLTRLRFKVDFTQSPVIITVNSEETIREPFLNFILDIQWPKGQMLKEYTVFLNPK